MVYDMCTFDPFDHMILVKMSSEEDLPFSNLAPEPRTCRASLIAVPPRSPRVNPFSVLHLAMMRKYKREKRSASHTCTSVCSVLELLSTGDTALLCLIIFKHLFQVYENSFSWWAAKKSIIYIYVCDCKIHSKMTVRKDLLQTSHWLVLKKQAWLNKGHSFPKHFYNSIC